MKNQKKPSAEERKEEINPLDAWQPKTALGRDVKAGKITSLDEIFSQGKNILEPEIVDFFLPDTQSELLLIGQSKGKFGGGKRRIFRQTQKKTKEGNKPKFATMAVIGNKQGFVGIGFGKAKETVPAREKAIRNAKINIFKVVRGSGSWEAQTAEQNSIPFTVEGKCGSVLIKLMPAPRGKGLVAEKEVAKILNLAGITDIWSKTKGQTKNKLNLIYATEKALKKIASTKVKAEQRAKLGIDAEPAAPVEEQS